MLRGIYEETAPAEFTLKVVKLEFHGTRFKLSFSRQTTERTEEKITVTVP